MELINKKEVDRLITHVLQLLGSEHLGHEHKVDLVTIALSDFKASDYLSGDFVESN